MFCTKGALNKGGASDKEGAELGGTFLWGPYATRTLLFRVLYEGPLFSETTKCNPQCRIPSEGHPFEGTLNTQPSTLNPQP